METGSRGLYVDDVAALLGLYHVPTQRREEILTLVRDGNNRNWWQVQEGQLPAMWQDLKRFEAEAKAIHNYELAIVPGLLQIPEYTRAFSADANDLLTTDEVENLVSARMSRQGVLSKPGGPTLDMFIDEAVLRRTVGHQEIMYRQLRHVVDSATHPNVTVHVIPLDTGAHPGLEGPFVLLEFVNEPTLVYLEHRGNSAFLEKPEHVTATKQSLRRLHELALSPDDSIELIARIAAEMT